MVETEGVFLLLAFLIILLRQILKGQFFNIRPFKIEGLIQLYPNKDVILISPNTLRKFDKDHSPEIKPKFKYQKDSYLLALYLLKE